MNKPSETSRGRTAKRGIYTGEGYDASAEKRPERAGAREAEKGSGAEKPEQESGQRLRYEPGSKLTEYESQHQSKYEPGSRLTEHESQRQSKYEPGSKQTEYESQHQSKYEPGSKLTEHGSQRQSKYEPGSKLTEHESQHQLKYEPGSKRAEYETGGRQAEYAAGDTPGEGVKPGDGSAAGDGKSRLAETQKKDSARRRTGRRKLLATAGAVFAVLYIGTAVYFGFHFYHGTQFYGIDCSYKTADQVRAEAAEKLDQYVLEIRERDDRTETIRAQQIGLVFEGGEGVGRMMRAQRSYIWPVMMLLGGAQSGQEKVFSYDKELAAQTVGALNCMDTVRSVAPRDAYIGVTDAGYEVVREVMGTTVDPERTSLVLTEALDAGETSVSLEEKDCYVDPKLYSDDEGLNRDAAAMNELARANITYDFGDRQEIVNAPVIDGWIVRLSDGTFTIDDARVAQYVEELAAKYDTFGLTRQFYTSIGTVETLTGGDYGWCIDQDATVTALLTALDEGYQGTMEPVYLYTAMSRETNDIGYTYVEVCISQQRMWCYQYGNLIVDTPVVTGNPNKGNGTPSGGVWAIDAKMRDYVLKGEGYTAPVDYWMPFNDDVGIHDMQARAQFGGTIYLSNGSHGCVNTPYEQAEIIYNAVSIGTPVIVYE